MRCRMKRGAENRRGEHLVASHAPWRSAVQQSERLARAAPLICPTKDEPWRKGGAYAVAKTTMNCNRSFPRIPERSNAAKPQVFRPPNRSPDIPAAKREPRHPCPVVGPVWSSAPISHHFSRHGTIDQCCASCFGEDVCFRQRDSVARYGRQGLAQPF